MYNSKAYAERELDHQNKLKLLYEKELKTLPEGKLSVSTIQGKNYYFRFLHGKKTYLGTKENDMVKKLQKRYVLEKALRRINQNQKVLEAVIKNYSSFTEDMIMDKAPKAYRELGTAGLWLTASQGGGGWGDQHYTKNTKYPERLQHRTLKGDLVRSKSEAIIANLLFAKGIPYRYEELVHIADKTIAPDFRIYVKSENRIKLLEYFGMIGDSDYLDHAIWKIRFYLESGLKPWDDVIFTFEDVQGNIDTRQVDTIIDQFLT